MKYEELQREVGKDPRGPLSPDEILELSDEAAELLYEAYMESLTGVRERTEV